MNFNDYFIEKNLSLRDAMKKIDSISPKIVFIAEKNKVIASLTDGDIRRFLLSGGSLNEPAIFAGNSHPLCAKNEYEAIELYDKNTFTAIPIIDKNNEIINIFIGKKNKIKSSKKLNIPIVINAGGKGTRLEPYTKILPKPLIPVGELPIIEHIMQGFAEYGCEKFSMIVNYKKELIKAYFNENEKKYDITWYDEEKPLGTGGGLCYLKNKINETFIFTNCDNLLLSNYDSIIRFHRENKNHITMICALKNVKIPYGVVEMGENGSIKSMKEKPEFSFLTNTGIYVVEPNVIDNIEDNVPTGFPDIIEREIKNGNKIAIYPVSEKEWLDMGQISELEKMRIRLYGE